MWPLIRVFGGRGGNEMRNFVSFLGHFEVETTPSRPKRNMRLLIQLTKNSYFERMGRSEAVLCHCHSTFFWRRQKLMLKHLVVQMRQLRGKLEEDGGIRRLHIRGFVFSSLLPPAYTASSSPWTQLANCFQLSIQRSNQQAFIFIKKNLVLSQLI